jgi:hypothetical protein
VTFSKTVFINTNRPVGLQKKEARRFAERTGLWKFVMTTIIADHTKQAVVWLKAIRPKGPWTLASIHPETAAIAVKSFKLKELEAMREWIAERNAKLNLYIVINVTKRRMNKKPREVDMARVDFTYVDCDPLDHETPEEAHTRHLAKLESGVVPLPSMNYVSGNGLSLVAARSAGDDKERRGYRERQSDQHRPGAAARRQSGGIRLLSVHRPLTALAELPEHSQREEARQGPRPGNGGRRCESS